ncbi:MAG: hypothetical protein ACT4P1_15705 [Sporichthyaceae bacterium]
MVEKRRKPGPKPKGVRSQITLRIPSRDREVYAAAAAAAGLPLCDYIAIALAAAHGLPEPEFLQRRQNQEELPLAKAS